jgi:alpha-galactosidase
MTGQWSGTRDTGERPIYAGWGGAQADATPYDQTLQVAGRSYDTGIGVLAQSRLQVRTRGAARFEAMVGVDDSTRDTRDAAEFLVYGDGRLLARSGAMRFGMAARPLQVALRGVHLVELVTRKVGHATDLPLVTTWAEAALRGGGKGSASRQ